MRPQLAEFDAIHTERLADLLMLSHEAMFAWKLDGAIEFWNAGAEQLYGFPANEAVGHSSHSLLQTKFPIKVAELHSQLRDNGYWSGELRHVCKEGREVIVDSRMQLLADDMVLEVNRDVTQFKAVLASLQESEQRLRWLGAFALVAAVTVLGFLTVRYYGVHAGWWSSVLPLPQKANAAIAHLASWTKR